ncbi:MAG: acylneuraminate cytidylyltransferase [Pirellulaceae bacterium]
MNVLAVIPARGGSKGIPRKNLMTLSGLPLIGHTIRAAQAAQHVTRVLVSTDDAEISVVSRRLGAEVLVRPTEISGDGASSEAALLHALETLRERENYVPELLVFLQCTSPLTSEVDIDGAVELLLEEGADSALSVVPFHYFVWRQDDEGAADGVNHDKRVRPLRQDRPEEFLETGAVYAMRTAGLLEHKHRFFGKTALYVMPPERRWEIDDPVDLRVAEVLLRDRMRGETLQMLPDPVEAVVFDFDGVFTDNRVVVDQDGRESVACSRGDGLGVELLRKSGVPALVLSKEPNRVVQQRCMKLQLPCLQGVDDKLPVLRDWAEANRIRLRHTVYMGNDVNDIDCLLNVGCGVAVADGHPLARQAARIVLAKDGGHGAVRELVELVLERNTGATT